MLPNLQVDSKMSRLPPLPPPSDPSLSFCKAMKEFQRAKIPCSKLQFIPVLSSFLGFKLPAFFSKTPLPHKKSDFIFLLSPRPLKKYPHILIVPNVVSPFTCRIQLFFSLSKTFLLLVVDVVAWRNHF